MEPQAARREQDDGGERGRPGDTQPCRWQIAGGWRLERERERVSRLFTLRTEKMVMVGEGSYHHNPHNYRSVRWWGGGGEKAEEYWQALIMVCEENNGSEAMIIWIRNRHGGV